MTVAQLITELYKYSPELDVFCEDGALSSDECVVKEVSCDGETIVLITS